MTPLGHASVSYVLTLRRPNLAVPIVIAGLAPDIDFVLVGFGYFNDLHRVITHNLLFVAVVGCTLGVVYRSPRTSAFALLAGVLHLLIDSMLDTNASNGIGVAWLWPLSSGVWTPLNLLFWSPGVNQGWNDPKAMLRAAAPLLLIEAPFICAAVWLFLRRRYDPSSSRL